MEKGHIFQEDQHVLEHPFDLILKSPQWQNQNKESGPTKCANMKKGWNNNHRGFEHVKSWLIHHPSTTQIEGS
jgi:hypothetical protein